MPQNNAPAPADGPTYARPNHSMWCQILIWVAAASLTICGVVALIFAVWHFKHLSHVVLSFYLSIFGAVVVCAELRLTLATRCFGFLCTQFGLGAFFIFAGTLGLSFGIGKSIGTLVPFIAGACWCVVGGLCITDSAIQGKRSGTTAYVEGV